MRNFKKFTTLTLAAALAVSMLATTPVSAKMKTTKVSNSKTYEIEGQTLIDFSYSRIKVLGNSKAAKKINRVLYSKTKKFMSGFSDEKEYILQSMAESQVDNANIADNMSTSEYTMAVQANNDRYFSVSAYTYVDRACAPHPNSNITGLTFDAKTGKRVGLLKVTGLSSSELKKRIIRKLNTYNKKNPDQLYTEEDYGIDYAEIIKETKIRDIPFFVKGNYAYISFEPYFIAPYACGYITIRLKIQK